MTDEETRDMFAAYAIEAVFAIARTHYTHGVHDDNGRKLNLSEVVAVHAYGIADAMMAERDKRGILLT